MATKTRQLADFLVAGGVSDAEIQSVPHIRPGILQPAVAGKLLDGTTNHSGNYGTTQSDGHSYYYTDIKGSKPIKDPRIGAHFGSQRYPIRSIQLLEQETATYGENVYSIDGREYFRVWGEDSKMINDSNGEFIHFDTSNHGYVEIVGYLSGLNMHVQTLGGTGMVYKIDGGSFSAEQTTFQTSVTSPLRGRYVNAGSLVNVFSDQTLGIHTVQLRTHATGDDWYLHGIELIAQDTSSTANKSKIQIPSQNVVSYGKKFTVSGTPHYDPFNGFTSGTDISGYIDTATSLGMSNWKVSSTWYRPFNGGRVVKWVDSSGTIKTSVNMMPPNAQNIGTTASNAIDLSSSQTNDDTINFNTSAVDHSLSEVAKTFHWREFGNGAANGGTGATYADASMLDGTSDDIAYVMDDGLTSLSGDDVKWGSGQNQFSPVAQDDFYYITFIGTGITLHDSYYGAGMIHLAQNLPYGTHVLKVNRGSAAHPAYWVDGVSYGTVSNGSYGNFNEVTFHQPKKPPIPEDAVIISDYMLMADLVVQTAGEENISKGVRMQSHSRDIFVDAVGTTGTRLFSSTGYPMGLTFDNDGVLTGGGASRSVTQKLPYFGTDFLINHYANRIGTVTENLNSDAGTSTAISTSGNDGLTKHIGNALGVNEMKAHITNGQNDDRAYTWASFYATPIHTSSHYQTFETPFLHELVGGDRNMEQTNLVVTPDGKTWDEVTRDMSYLGPRVEMHCARDGGHVSGGSIWFGDYWRGLTDGKDHYNKGIAIAYDRVIILEDGYYEVSYQNYHHNYDGVVTIVKNNTTGGVDNGRMLRNDDADETQYGMRRWHCKRGDYITIKVDVGTNTADGSNVGYNEFRIIKIG